MTPQKKRTAKSKRVSPPREVGYTKKFFNNWEKVSHSGQHDMNVLKDAMMLLIANDAPLPPEWKDHQLNGAFDGLRECHIKGDLLLVYQLSKKSDIELITFYRVGTHSEIF